jgi:hypothetical protein
VRPARCEKPVKLKATSVGVLQFIPSNWHMAERLPRKMAESAKAWRTGQFPCAWPEKIQDYRSLCTG